MGEGASFGKDRSHLLCKNVIAAGRMPAVVLGKSATLQGEGNLLEVVPNLQQVAARHF